MILLRYGLVNNSTQRGLTMRANCELHAALTLLLLLSSLSCLKSDGVGKLDRCGQVVDSCGSVV